MQTQSILTCLASSIRVIRSKYLALSWRGLFFIATGLVSLIIALAAQSQLPSNAAPALYNRPTLANATSYLTTLTTVLKKSTNSGAWDGQNIYRASFIVDTLQGQSRFRVWYSAFKDNGNNGDIPHIGYTEHTG